MLRQAQYAEIRRRKFICESLRTALVEVSAGDFLAVKINELPKITLIPSFHKIFIHFIRDICVL